MEFQDGLDLHQMGTRFGPQPAERVVMLLRQACRSLAEAHDRGLVHRDIKPANLFVCKYGGEYDFVKVLDFGIAKAAPDMMETGQVGFTRDNILQGTPAYMAPEQVLQGPQIDGRADIYATGCVAYFLVTGKPVFTAATPMAVVVQHANASPPRPSDNSELSIPPALDQVILQCLAKDPADRPQSARELSRRLANISSLTPWTDERAREWWERHQPARRG
jgi:serine/threonine protein kinase